MVRGEPARIAACLPGGVCRPERWKQDEGRVARFAATDQKRRSGREEGFAKVYLEGAEIAGEAMTIPNWGRITPSQGDMLMLAGHVLRCYPVPQGTVEPDEDRLEAMRQGRESLRRLTGQDFGYDLARWHGYLLENDQWDYQHPYEWQVVQPAIERVLTDPDRLRLAKLLEADSAHFALAGKPCFEPIARSWRRNCSGWCGKGRPSRRSSGSGP